MLVSVESCSRDMNNQGVLPGDDEGHRRSHATAHSECNDRRVFVQRALELVVRGCSQQPASERLVPNRPHLAYPCINGCLRSTCRNVFQAGDDRVDFHVAKGVVQSLLPRTRIRLDSPRVSGAVIVDGVGVEVEDHPMTNVAGLAPADLAKLSFHDPAKAPRPPAGGGSGPSPDIAALIAYAGPTMSDPSLIKRLTDHELPVHVIWGESDGIVGPEYGKAYADAIPMSAFTVLPRSGHLPQLETPEELLGAITDLGH